MMFFVAERETPVNPCAGESLGVYRKGIIGLDESIFNEHSNDNDSIESVAGPSVDQHSVGVQGCLIVKLDAGGLGKASIAVLDETHFVKHGDATYNKKTWNVVFFNECRVSR